jgi:hypothetical protein
MQTISRDLGIMGSLTTPLQKGAWFYATLVGGEDFEYQPVADHERGYHSTSLYCLQRAVHNRSLTPGPGQLSPKDVRSSAVYYHREPMSRLCLGSYNHYVALRSGPWFYAVVLLLDVNPQDPRLWVGDTRLPVTIRGQGLTYPGMHRVCGFFLHMVHAAEIRYLVEASYHVIAEGAWSGALELPADLEWNKLVERCFDLRGDQSWW